MGVGVLQRLSDIEIAIGYAGAKWILDNTGVPASFLLGDVGQDKLEAIPDYILTHGRVFAETHEQRRCHPCFVCPFPIEVEVAVPSDHVVVRVVYCSGLAIHGQVSPDLDAVVAGLVWVKLGTVSHNHHLDVVTDDLELIGDEARVDAIIFPPVVHDCEVALCKNDFPLILTNSSCSSMQIRNLHHRPLQENHQNP